MQLRAYAEIIRTGIHVLPDFRLPGICPRPLRIRRERKAIKVRRHIAGRTGIGIVAPGPADTVGLLQYHIGHSSLLHPDRDTQAGKAGADYDGVKGRNIV